MSADPSGPIDCASLIKDGWFMEKNPQWPGQATSLEVKEVLLHKKTDFQDLMVFKSTTWGNVMVLDGVIQLTEKDEMSYQEMLTHIPMFSHPEPKQVLIIGGGDGGVLREVVKHTCVEKVTMCEIDGGVPEASKKFFPNQSTGFGHEKANLVIGDGLAFAKNAADATYDVIVVDSSDPVGPAEGLFSKEFYDNAHRILKPGGILGTQGECLWVHADLIETVLKENGAAFASAEYASMQVPTYPSGQIGAFVGRKAFSDTAKDPSCKVPARGVPQDMDLNYYTSAMHSAAFALPAFLMKRLYKEGVPGTK
jgi:spermidine synthase